MATDAEQIKVKGEVAATNAPGTDAAMEAVEQKDSTSAAAAAEQPTTATADVPPNQTIYVNNINEKIKQVKRGWRRGGRTARAGGGRGLALLAEANSRLAIDCLTLTTFTMHDHAAVISFHTPQDELKKTLYLIFGAFGNIVEINCQATYKMRGQAWIVFDSLGAATRAHRELQNFLFFGKPLRIAFAKAKSDTISRIEGTYQQRLKRKGPEVDTRPKKGSTQGSAKRQKTDAGEKKKKTTDATNAVAATAAAPVAPVVPAPSAAVVFNEPPPPPHRILFVENLPAQANDLMLGMLFQQYPGYKEARVIAGKQVAFVEFDEVFQAGTALDALQGFKITATNLMKITFAKQ